MPSSYKVLTRIQQRISDLSQDFGGCLDYFDAAEPFVGPSGYFHRKTLAARSVHTSIPSLLKDDLFFDWLYATLTAWGLHRMGPGNTKLRDLEEIKESFREQTTALESLSDFRITRLTSSDGESITPQIWSILSSLRISVAKAQIVANSKALHHVLPALVPPIDREYIFNFFYNRKSLSIPEDEAFPEIYGGMCRLAADHAEEINLRIGEGFHTSEAKVIDNAIVGYVLKMKGPVSD